MKKKSALILIFAVIILGILAVGYAVENNELLITGTATAVADNSQFDVKFTGTPTRLEGATAGVTATGAIDTTDSTGRTATINASGFKKVGDTVSIKYTVLNNSVEDLSAKIVAEVTENTNSNYIQATVAPETAQTVASQGTTEYTVTITCVKTPLTEVSSNIKVTLTATAVES